MWFKKFKEEEENAYADCTVNITPDEILKAKSLEQLQSVARDAKFCHAFCLGADLWAGITTIKETPQEELQQYERARTLLVQIKDLISKI